MSRTKRIPRVKRLGRSICKIKTGNRSFVIVQEIRFPRVIEPLAQSDLAFTYVICIIVIYVYVIRTHFVRISINYAYAYYACAYMRIYMRTYARMHARACMRASTSIDVYVRTVS